MSHPRGYAPGMAIKTTATDADVTAFLDAVPDERRRAEGHAMRALMERITGEKAVMWGPTIVGFGSRPYTNTIGTADMLLMGFSPRKGALTLYGVYNDNAPREPLFDQLGPHETGKGCLYVKRLDAVDGEVLETLIRTAWDRTVARG
jgi:hypothetical protein